MARDRRNSRKRPDRAYTDAADRGDKRPAAVETEAESESSPGGGIAVQAGILAIATIVVRIIGLLYRAPLTAIIGDEGSS